MAGLDISEWFRNIIFTGSLWWIEYNSFLININISVIYVVQYKKICGNKCNICGYSKTNYVGLICLKDVPQTSWNDVSNTFCHQVSYDVFLWCHPQKISSVLQCLPVMSLSKICQKLFVLWCLTVMSPSKICQKSLKFSQLQLALIQWEIGLFSWFF